MSLTSVGSLNLTVAMIDHIVIKIKVDDKVVRGNYTSIVIKTASKRAGLFKNIGISITCHHSRSFVVEDCLLSPFTI